MSSSTDIGLSETSLKLVGLFSNRLSLRGIYNVELLNGHTFILGNKCICLVETALASIYFKETIVFFTEITTAVQTVLSVVCLSLSNWHKNKKAIIQSQYSKRGIWEYVPAIGDHTPQPPWENLGYWKGEFQFDNSWHLRFRRNNSVFVLTVKHVNSSILCTGCSRVHGSLPKQSKCVLWTWRHVPLTVPLVASSGRCFGSMGSEAFC